MASVGHIAVGMVAARAYQRGAITRTSAFAFWSLVSLAPDLDVIGFRLGVPYGDPWGHRGATHSLTFAVALGSAIALAGMRWKRPFARTALVAGLLLVSHPLLDTMTDGGLGCALFWPFDLTRYFAPWRPIPVAPIGVAILSLSGLMVVLVELVLFAPAFMIALRPSARSTIAVVTVIALWVPAVLIIRPGAVSRDTLIGFLVREDTMYARGFSEDAFRTVAPGQSQRAVADLLGQPFRQVWFYTPMDLRPPDERPAPSRDECLAITLQTGTVALVNDAAACARRGVRIGESAAVVEDRLGPPRESCWQYSWSAKGVHYRQRLVCFSNAKVRMIVRNWS
jgi:inner membrane protein